MKENWYKAGVALQQAVDAAALLRDGQAPAAPALIRLVPPFQQMGQQDPKLAFQLPLAVSAHVFNLIDQVDGIQLTHPASPDQISLLAGPGAKVLPV